MIGLLAKLCGNRLAGARVAGTLSEWFPFGRGVRQGCVLSPYLFNILAEMVMRETLDGFQGGLQIGGRMITNFRYADDIILLATSEGRTTGVGGSPRPSQPRIHPQMEKVRTWCGQPSDRGRLKNRTAYGGVMAHRDRM